MMNPHYESFNNMGMPPDVMNEVAHVTNVAQCIRLLCEATEQKDVSQADCLVAASLLTAARITAGQELSAVPPGECN